VPLLPGFVKEGRSPTKTALARLAVVVR
jgi:hypothetical protein